MKTISVYVQKTSKSAKNKIEGLVIFFFFFTLLQAKTKLNQKYFARSYII